MMLVHHQPSKSLPGHRDLCSAFHRNWLSSCLSKDCANVSGAVRDTEQQVAVIDKPYPSLARIGPSVALCGRGKAGLWDRVNQRIVLSSNSAIVDFLAWGIGHESVSLFSPCRRVTVPILSRLPHLTGVSED